MCPQAGKAMHRPADRRRRRHLRYHADFPILVTLLGGDGYRRLDAHCKDLSVAGIGMLIAEELLVGEVVSLEFSLPGASERWEVRGVLRHRRGYHYGFEFLSLTRQQSETLSTFLQKQIAVHTE